jgi:MoaA/NifB/PqqE/SkfB family radical SAM enzyme
MGQVRHGPTESSAVADTDTLSPFVSTLRRRLGLSLRAWLEVPGACDVDFRVMPQGVDVRVQDGGSSFQLELRTPAVSEAGAWLLGESSLRIRRGGSRGQVSQVLQAVLEALVQRRAEGRLEPESVLAALAAYRPFRGIDDRFYRNLEIVSAGRGAMLRLGFRCNQDCGFCWQARDWPAPSEDLYWTWLDEIGGSGAEWITISGGEPTLYRRLPELIERAHAVHGLRVTLQTNAIQLAKPGYAESLAKAGLEVMLVSLHAADAALSDRMTRAPNTYVRTIAGIHAALKSKIKVGFNCMVERENVAQLPALAQLIVSEFAAAYAGLVLVVNFSQAGDYHDQQRFEREYVSLTDARPPLLAAARMLTEAGIAVEVGGTCGFPLCVFHGHEELLQPARAELDAGHMSARTHEASICQSCARTSSCVGVRRAYLTRFGEAGLMPFASPATAGPLG